MPEREEGQPGRVERARDPRPHSGLGFSVSACTGSLQPGTAQPQELQAQVEGDLLQVVGPRKATAERQGQHCWRGPGNSRPQDGQASSAPPARS